MFCFIFAWYGRFGLYAVITIAPVFIMLAIIATTITVFVTLWPRSGLAAGIRRRRRAAGRVLMMTVLTTRATGVGHGAGVMFELQSQPELLSLLHAGGWTLLTAVNLMLFSLIHNPCSTTIYTIYKETKSLKWTTLATLLPLALGFIVTFVVAQGWRLVAGLMAHST
jgi:Fe2+ transport system protein B